MEVSTVLQGLILRQPFKGIADMRTARPQCRRCSDPAMRACDRIGQMVKPPPQITYWPEMKSDSGEQKR